MTREAIRAAILKGDSMEPTIDHLIEDVLKPFAKEAYEAGQSNYNGYQTGKDVEEWLSEKFNQEKK